MKWHVNAQRPPKKDTIKVWRLIAFIAILSLYYVLFTLPTTVFFILGIFWKSPWVLGRVQFSRIVKSFITNLPWMRVDASIQIPKTDRKILFISNHRSHLDIFLYLVALPRLRAFAKIDLFRVPFLGLFMWLTRQIPLKGSIESFKKALDTAGKAMAEKDQVLIFPELTRCPPGHVGTQKFQQAPFILAMEQDAIILPFALSGTDAYWPKGSFAMSSGSLIELRSLEPIDTRDFSSSLELTKAVRKRIDDDLLGKAILEEPDTPLNDN